MKKIVSIILCFVMLFSTMSAFAESENSVELKKYGVMNGDTNGDMRLNDDITRAEAVCMVFRMLGIDANRLEDVRVEFTDMEKHWAAKEVTYAKKSGIIDDEINTAFNPDEKVTNQEFIKMVLIVLGYNVQADSMGGYPNGYIHVATMRGVTKNVAAKMQDNITRGDAALILCNALDIPLMKVVGFGAEKEYAIMDGTNGYDLQTLRTLLEVK
ncbi:MAG: S-layer homology domain-containing protein [Clostridia bacterium]|nr:S-layer homology domain-containing protein [Clostridia bacterium]